MKRFVFYDFETTGISPKYDQPLQFAAIVTDEDFNTLETIDIRCQIAPHILPAPFALLVTNISPYQTTNSNLPTAFEFAQTLSEFVQKWQPAIWLGYNTIAFDEQMLRQLFYQNLQPSIYATQMNGNSRLDVMKMVFAAHSLRPGLIKIPETETGKLSFKLDQIAPLNGFPHANAHDALADVEATIFITKKLKDQDPEFYEKLILTQDKDFVESQLRSFQPMGVTLRFGGGLPKTYRGCYCGTNSRNKNEIGFVPFDGISAQELVGFNDTEIQAAIDQSPKIIRPLRLNNAETFMALEDSTPEELEFCNIVSQSSEFLARFGKILPQRFKDDDTEIDLPIEEKIYGGFYSNYDQDLLREFQTADWNQRQDIAERFDDKRLVQLGRRIITFYASHLISDVQREAFKRFVYEKWTNTDNKPGWTTIETLKQDLADMESKQAASSQYLHELKEFYSEYLGRFGCDFS